MGHKVHPYGYRLGYTRTWTAKWYADKEYTTLLREDIAIRQLLDRRLANASVSGVEIERGINHVTVSIHTAKPGIVIGRGGQNVEILRKEIGELAKRKVKLEIKEIRQPELDAYLVALNIAQQLTRRVAYKKAMKQSIQRSMKAGAKGVKIALAGRLGGSEMGRREWDREGRIPLGTLRADISYGQVHAHTTYGRIGVKVRSIAATSAEARRQPGSRRSGGLMLRHASHRSDARPDVGSSRGGTGRLRRVRPRDPGAGLDHEPPDRGCPAGDDPLGQARRQDLDPDLPGQAGDQEAGRDQDGLRQGRPRPLGRGGQAGPDPLRDGRRGSRVRGRSDAPGQPQAADEHPRRRPRIGEGGELMDIESVRKLSDPELEDALKEAKQDLWGARFALSTRQLKDYSTIHQTRRTIARILTVQRERKLGKTA
jgi:small subunit ribosomal protein S3